MRFWTLFTLTVGLSVIRAEDDMVSDLRFVNNASNEIHVGSTVSMELTLTFLKSNTSLTSVRIELLTPHSREENVMAMIEAEVTYVGVSLDILPSSLETKMKDKEKGNGITVYHRRCVLEMEQVHVSPYTTAEEVKVRIQFQTILVPPRGVEIVDGETNSILTTIVYWTTDQSSNPADERTIQNSLPYVTQKPLHQGTPKMVLIATDNPYHNDCPMELLVNIQVRLHRIFHYDQVSIELTSDHTELNIMNLRLTDAGKNYQFSLEVFPTSAIAVPCMNQADNDTFTGRVDVGTLFNKDVANDRVVSDEDLLQFTGTIILSKQAIPNGIYHAQVMVRVNGNESVLEFVDFKAKPPLPFHVKCDAFNREWRSELKLNDAAGIQLTLSSILETQQNYLITSRIRSISPAATDGMKLYETNNKCQAIISPTISTYNCSKLPDDPLNISATVEPDMIQAGDLYRLDVDILSDEVVHNFSYFMEYVILNEPIILDPADKNGIDIQINYYSKSIGLKTRVNLAFLPPPSVSSNIPVALGTFTVEVPAVVDNKLPKFEICWYQKKEQSSVALGGVKFKTKQSRVGNATFNRTFFEIERLTYIPRRNDRLDLTLRIYVEYIGDVSGWDDKTTRLPVRVSNILNQTLDIGINIMRNFRVYVPNMVVITSIRILDSPEPFSEATFHYSFDGSDNREITIRTNNTVYLQPPVIAKYYRVSWPHCKLMTRQKINRFEVPDGIKILHGDNRTTQLARFLTILHYKTCMSLPVIGDRPPFLLISLKPQLLGVDQGPFKLSIKGIQLFCDGQNGKKLQVSYTTFDSISLCGAEVTFCRLHDFVVSLNNTSICSYICNCAPAVVSPIYLLITNSGTTPWSICDIDAIKY